MISQFLNSKRRFSAFIWGLPCVFLFAFWSTALSAGVERLAIGPVESIDADGQVVTVLGQGFRVTNKTSGSGWAAGTISIGDYVIAAGDLIDAVLISRIDQDYVPGASTVFLLAPVDGVSQSGIAESGSATLDLTPAVAFGLERLPQVSTHVGLIGTQPTLRGTILAERFSVATKGQSSDRSLLVERNSNALLSISGGDRSLNSISGGDPSALSVIGGDRWSLSISGGDTAPLSISGGDRAPLSISGSDYLVQSISGGDRGLTSISGSDSVILSISGGDRANHSISGGDRSNASISGGDRNYQSISGGDRAAQSISGGDRVRD